MGLGAGTRAFKEKALERTEAAMRGAFNEAADRVVNELSPVGDPALWAKPPPPGYVGGQFRSNWNYGLDQVDLSTTTATNIHTVNGLERMPERMAGHRHFVSNSLPYAQALEYGHSVVQAPAGILAVLSGELPDIAERQAREAAR